MTKQWPYVLTLGAWGLALLTVGCDHPVSGEFSVHPRVFCSGEALSFAWNLKNISHVRVIGADSGRTIAEGSGTETVSAPVDASDGKLDVLVTWVEDGREYSALQKVPDYVAPVLAVVNEDNDTWIALRGPTSNQTESVDGAWTDMGIGTLDCCPYPACVEKDSGGISWSCGGGVTTTSCQSASGAPGMNCYRRRGRLEEKAVVVRLLKSTLDLPADAFSSRVRLLALRNETKNSSFLSSTQLGVSRLKTGDEIQLSSPASIGGEVVLEFDPPPTGQEEVARRERFYTPTDPLSEGCKDQARDSRQQCSKARNECLASWDARGVRALLRCLKPTR